jgi:hypothetical protein
MQFVLQEIAQLGELSAMRGSEEVNLGLATAGKFANGVLSPLNIVGDRERSGGRRGRRARRPPKAGSHDTAFRRVR